MHIVALLSSELLGRLTDVIADAHTLCGASDGIELRQRLDAVDADLVIIDPTMADGRYAEAIEAAVAELPRLPVIVYTTVSAKAMALVLRLAPLGVRHLVLYGFDDDPQRLLELIERVPADPVIDLMLQALADQLSSLPAPVRRAVQSLFKSPTRVRTGADLARTADMTRRSLYRHMASVGLQPRHLIDCARLLRVYTLLRAPDARLKQASAQLGFARPQTLSDLLKDWTGLSARRIRQGIDPAAFVRLLSAHLLSRTNTTSESEVAAQPAESV